jgi:magnesium transporter
MPPLDSVIDEDEEESNLDYFYDDPGTPPGTLDVEADDPPPEMVLIDYSDEMATRLILKTPEECAP